jgi:hypothetical protein
LQGLVLGLNSVLVVRLECVFYLFDGGLDLFFLRCIKLVAVLGQALFDTVYVGIGFIFGLNQFKLLLVFG